MTRVSTFGQSQLLLADVLRNERNVFERQQQVTSGFKSPDYQGIARDVATLSGAKALEEKSRSFLDANLDLRRRMEVMDLTLQSTFEIADKLRNDVIAAVNTGSGISLRDKLNDMFDTAVSLLNTTANGRFIFAGTRTDTAPVSTSTPAQLTALGVGNHAQAFTNNTIKAQVQIDDNRTLTHGVLASEVAPELFGAFQRLFLFDDGTNNFGFATGGPFSDPLTDDQRAFLIQELPQITQAFDELNLAVARNGINMCTLEDTQDRHTADLTFLRIFIGDIQDVDAAEAISNLNLDQLALEASFRVFSQLTRLSLVDLI